jgi:hypothetical protein
VGDLAAVPEQVQHVRLEIAQHLEEHRLGRAAQHLDVPLAGTAADRPVDGVHLFLAAQLVGRVADHDKHDGRHQRAGLPRFRAVRTAGDQRRRADEQVRTLVRQRQLPGQRPQFVGLHVQHDPDRLAVAGRRGRP